PSAGKKRRRITWLPRRGQRRKGSASGGGRSWRPPIIARCSPDIRKNGELGLMRIRLFASATAVRDYFPLLRWMIFTGVTLFGFTLTWHYGLFQLMTVQDRSGIAVFICVLYVVISGHCLACTIGISREVNTAHR